MPFFLPSAVFLFLEELPKLLASFFATIVRDPHPLSVIPKFSPFWFFSWHFNFRVVSIFCFFFPSLV